MKDSSNKTITDFLTNIPKIVQVSDVNQMYLSLFSDSSSYEHL